MENRPTQRRGTYNKVSEECFNRIVAEAENGGDWRLIAAANGVNYKTAYAWLKKEGALRKKRGGKRHSKLSEDDVDSIIRWVEGNCQITLKAICERLREEKNILVSQQTVSKSLDGRLITYKKVRNIPEGVNSDENKAKRRSYVEELLGFVGQQKHIVFVDETNFNLYCRRNGGRSRRGERAVVKVPNSKGPNLHIVGCISSTNLEFWQQRRGAFKRDNFLEFMRHCLRVVANNGHNMEDIVVVLDNAPAHSRCEELMREEEFTGFQICRLAPYSCMLNPIEHIWSAVKTEIKRSLRENYNILIRGDPAGILTQKEFRLRFLENTVPPALQVVTAQMCLHAVNHVQKHYPGAMRLDDMPMGN